MTLRRAILYVIVGTSYLFLVRLIATIAPEINTSLVFFRTNSLLSLLAALTPVAFYAVFHRRFVREEQVLLEMATFWALIGSAAVACLFLKGPVIAFQLPIFLGVFRSALFESVGLGLAWVSSALILVFFLVLYRELRSGQSARLARATAFAVGGSSFALLLRSGLLLSSVITGDLHWVSDLPAGLQWGLLPLELLAFLATMYFFATLYHFQRIRHILDVA